MRRRIERTIIEKLVMNQDSQCTALPSPMTFITSLSRSSFSYTMPLTIIATVKIHARVMNKGIVREIALVNLSIAKYCIISSWSHCTVLYEYQIPQCETTTDHNMLL